MVDVRDGGTPTRLYQLVAMSLGTIPGCVAVGLVDGREHRVLASWASARVDLELAMDVFDQLASDVGDAAELLVSPAEVGEPGPTGAGGDMIVIAGGRVHLFDRIAGGLCFVAVCRASADLGSMLAAFRISRHLMGTGA